MRVGIASDHGGFALKKQIAELLRGSGYQVVDFGAHQLNPGDDYPDFVVPLARAVASGEVERAVALCDMNVFCLGGKVIGAALAWELIETFLTARFSGARRHQRRVAKVQALEKQEVLR